MKMSISIDGFVSTIDGRKDWLFKTGDEESLAWSVEKVSAASLIIMGRKSFETMAPYWPTATGPFTTPMNEIPKAVFTKKGFNAAEYVHAMVSEQSSAAASWAQTQVFDNLTTDVRSLKAANGKPIIAIGGVTFMQNLIATGLIDEYHMAVHPVALGTGLSVFASLKMPLYLKLLELKPFRGGVTAVTYCT